MTDPQPKWTSGELEDETEYRARTKYYAASGEESPWSDDVTFKTGKWILRLETCSLNLETFYEWRVKVWDATQQSQHP